MRKIIYAVFAIGILFSTAFAAPQDPPAQIDTLVKRLQTGKIDGVFTDLFSASLVAEQKPMQLRAADAQVKTALEVYGRPTSYEIIETSKMGASLMRVKWITKHRSETPLFWNGLFYRRNNKWEPLTVVFFDDPQKAGF